MSIVDLFRRLMLSSFLMLIRQTTVQLACALAISIFFATAFGSLHPFYEKSSDNLFHVTCWVVAWCIIGLLIKDLSELAGPGHVMYMSDVSISILLVRSGRSRARRL